MAAEEEKKQEETSYVDKIKHMVVEELKRFSDTTELHGDELDVLYKLVDIDKDLENIDYWKTKKEVMKMRYNNYRDYSDGEYSENYGRRGVPGTGRSGYRGHDEGVEMIEDMKDSYGAYSESRYNYGTDREGMKALEDTMEIFTEFAQKMIQEVDSPEAKQIVKKHLRKISQMG
jgi:hypothetical protein